MGRLDSGIEKVIETAVYNHRGSGFLKWEQIIKQAKGDYQKIAEIISRDSGKKISLGQVRLYCKKYRISIT
jgi:hypothetical protein